MNLEYQEQSTPKTIEEVYDTKPGTWRAFVLKFLGTDLITYSIYGFWGSLNRRLHDFVPYKIRSWWTEHIRTIYAPQHSELRAAIPKTWADLTSVIPSFLYASIISFVEGEDGLKMWEAQDPEHPAKKNAAMLKEVYDWAKTGRAAEEQRILDLHPPFASGSDIFKWLNEENAERDAACKRVQEAEDAFDEKDCKYLQWIVSRNALHSLWT